MGCRVLYESSLITKELQTLSVALLFFPFPVPPRGKRPPRCKVVLSLGRSVIGDSLGMRPDVFSVPRRAAAYASAPGASRFLAPGVS